MIYAVIDTNVLVSALLSRLPDTATVLVVKAISKSVFRPLYNKEILAEYREVLSRPKFSFPPQKIASILDAIQEIGVLSDRVESQEYFPDPKDIVFYEVAISKDDAYLVTGNTKHFPKKPIVVTPSEMLEILKTESKL
jgi:putative PIN family toxin of toxin-antitoxin system